MQFLGSMMNRYTGKFEEYYYDEDKDVIVARKSADVQENIDENKREFNLHNGIGYGDTNGIHKVASIPLVVLEQWRTKDGFDWFKSTDKERRAWLDKPENALFKVRPGKLSGVTGRKLNCKSA